VSSGGEVSTHLDKPYGQQPETRAAAVRVLRRQPDAEDLMAILGLDDVELERPEPPPYVVINGRTCCATCRQQVRADGVCRYRNCAVGARNQEGDGLCAHCRRPLPAASRCRRNTCTASALAARAAQAQSPDPAPHPHRARRGGAP
jgi:hypothetical protein